MTQSSTTESLGSKESIFDTLHQVLFFKTIRFIKTVGCYMYLAVVLSLISFLCLLSIVLVGMAVCSFLGTFFGVLTGLLLFGWLLLGPFKDWMQKLTAATRTQFFAA